MEQTIVLERKIDVFAGGYMPPDMRRLLRLQELIEVEFKYHKRTTYYADKIKMTVKAVNRLTKSYLNRSVHELIELRLHQEALKLLQFSTLTVKEITYELGISDPSWFTKCFKRIEGVSPKEFRNQQHKAIISEN